MIRQSHRIFFKRAEENRKALNILLDHEVDERGYLLACRSEMGGIVSYITSVSLEWVARKIRFAGDLPIFVGKVNPDTKEIPIDEETIDVIQQRSPDWSRQIAMTMYLIMREYHKFPPLLVVAYQPWIYRDDADEWSAKHATKDSINADPLGHKGLYFKLNETDTNFYALDGQHRLMAILGLRDLVEKKRLYKKGKNGTNTKSYVTIDQVSEELERMGKEKYASIAAFEDILNENIGIEIIPAVARNETYRKSLFRLRSVFVDVNENAKKITINEGHKLDETEGFRIVARKSVVKNDLLKERTDTKSSQLDRDSDKYTTLDAVVKIAKNYLLQLGEFKGWWRPVLGVQAYGYIRPDDKELEDAAVELNRYFDALSKLPSHKRLIDGIPAGKIRRGPQQSDDKSKNYEDNVLFRPVAQMALAEAVGYLVKEHEVNLDDIVKVMSRQENKGQMKLTDPKAPWFGVLCDGSHKMRKNKKYQDLASVLFIYLLGNGYDTKDEQDELRDKLWEARCFQIDAEKVQDFNGKFVKRDDFRLPTPWQ